MFTIELTQGQQAVVDEHDWYELRKHRWRAHWDPKMQSFYAVKNFPWANGKRHAIRMHRVIMGLLLGDKRQVHHINHDTLDNRRKNLRILTPREHTEYRRDRSQYGVGVYRDSRCPKNPYRAKARIDGKQKHIGYYVTPEEAQEARRKFLHKEEKR